MTATEQTAMDVDADDQVGEHLDGRTMRRTRNRTAVINALLQLIREGVLHPGAAEIADRAGVSHRSIFRYFDDLDDLVRTAIDHAFLEAGPLAEIPESGIGARSDRIERFVESRITLFAHVDGAMQVARMRAGSIPPIDEDIAAVARTFQTQIAHHFATELAPLDDSERSFLIDGVLVLTSYDAYTIHRRVLTSDDARMNHAWCVALNALLPA